MKHRHSPRFPLGWLFVIGLLTVGFMPLIGCGPSGHKKISLSGKISYRGKPLGGGTIYLYPADGGKMLGPINPDGTFSFGGIPPGVARVAIETESIRATTERGDSIPMKPPPGMSLPAVRKKNTHQPTYVPIPKKFADPKTSTLTWDVQSGKSSRDFELTD